MRAEPAPAALPGSAGLRGDRDSVRLRGGWYNFFSFFFVCMYLVGQWGALRSVLVAVLWWRLRGRAPSAVASLCFVFCFLFFEEDLLDTGLERRERNGGTKKGR